MKKLIPFIFIFFVLIFAACHSYRDRPVIMGDEVKNEISASTKSTYIKGGSIGVNTEGVYTAILDEQDRMIMQRNSPRTVDRMDRKEPLTISDIIKLTQNGVSDELIHDYITQSNTIYRLSKSQIKRMQQNGVSQRIINFMLEKNK